MSNERAFGAVSEHVRGSPWAQQALLAVPPSEIADLEAEAAAKDVVVGIVKRGDGRWMARAGDKDGIGVTPVGAALIALGKVED